MENKKRIALLHRRWLSEMTMGIVIVIIGVVIESWARHLYWIQIYPPPLAKQILDALPGIFWIAGGMIAADGLWHLLILNISVDLRFTTSLILGLALTLCSTLYGNEINWPDFYHINYGAPFSWMTRILVTIAGPVDQFRIDFPMLVLDIVFWSVISGSALLLLASIRSRR
ncbi:MAG: hypothetical protein V1857_05075 [archaeon]